MPATFTQTRPSEAQQDLHGLNAFFANTVTAKNRQEHLENVDQASPYTSLHPVSPVEVYNELKLTDKASTSGPDGLSGQLIKELAPALCGNISTICNSSITQGRFF